MLDTDQNGYKENRIKDFWDDEEYARCCKICRRIKYSVTTGKIISDIVELAPKLFDFSSQKNMNARFWNYLKWRYIRRDPYLKKFLVPW